MNIRFVQEYFDPNLNQWVKIEFEPSQNDNSTLQIVNLSSAVFVITSLQLLSWNNDIELGLSNPQQAELSVKVDQVESDSSIPANIKEYFFNSFLQPYKILSKTFQIDGATLDIQYFESNLIRIYSSMSPLVFKQDVYTTITPQTVSNSSKYVTTIDLSCIDIWSFYMKNTPPEFIRYVTHDIETTGIEGVDWTKSKFAFDYFANLCGQFGIEDGNVKASYNQFWCDQTQLATVISGNNAVNGKFTGDNINNNRNDARVFKNTFGNQNIWDGEPYRFSVAWPATFSWYNFAAYNIPGYDVDGDPFDDWWAVNSKYYSNQYENVIKSDLRRNGNDQRHFAMNGFSNLFFINVSGLANWISKGVETLFDGKVLFNAQAVDIDWCFKQNYNEPYFYTTPVPSSNIWILYKVIGSGDINRLIKNPNNGAISNEFLNNEYYLNSKSFADNLLSSYSSIFDFIVDLQASSLNSQVITPNGLLQTSRQYVKTLSLIGAPISINISFGYQSINIQTGSVDPVKSDETISVIVSPGSSQNLNIPQLFNAYPINPANAVNQTFVPVVYNQDSTLNAPDVYQSTYCVYLKDDVTSPQYLDLGTPPLIQKQDRAGSPNPMFENWGNCGFYYTAPNSYLWSPSTDWDNIARRWNIYMFQEPNYHDAISGFGHANYRGLDNELGGTIRGATFTEPYTSNQTRRPFQALNLNEPNLTPFKLWYRESYANMEERSQGLYSTFPDRYTMVACASMFNYVYNDQAILENSLTGFDWRVDNVGSAPDYRDDINYWGGSDTVRLIDTPVTQSYTRDFLIENLKRHRDMSMYAFDKYWVDTIKRKIIGEDFNNLDNYIKIVVTLTCKPSVYIKLFGKIGLEDVASISFFNFNLTNNPYQQILNTTYKCVGLEYDGSDIISKWAKATEEELANTVPWPD